MSNIKLYIINYTVPQYNKIGIASVTASSATQAQNKLQASGKYNAYKYNMSYPVEVHTTDTFTAEDIITELDNPAGEKGDRGPRGLKGDKGDKGLTGDPFVYSDFTSEQLANLKGEKGDKGDKGEKGDPLTWDSMDPEDKITLKEDIEENVKNDLKNGYNPSMTVGKAENLVGRGESTEVEFSFRPSAGSLSIEDGSAKITSIKGNSVVWNQLISNGNFSNGTTGWQAETPTKAQLSAQNGELTVTAINTPDAFYNLAYGTSATLSFIGGHKYLYVAEINSPYQTNIVLRNPNVIDMQIGQITLATKININSWTLCAGIFTGKTITSKTPYCAPQSGYALFETGDSYSVRNVRLIDLTQMFGDGNEPTSYEKYLQRKPMNIADEYAYNAGTLVDMRVNEIVSVGDNAYNPKLGHARVLGGKEYNIYFSVEGIYEMYFSRTLEGDKEPIDAISNPMTFPADGYVWIIGINGEPLYSDNVCICLRHSYPKPVIPYEQDVKDLSFISELFPNGMHSASAAPNSFQHIYDEIFFNKTIKKWTLIKRIGSTVVTKDTPINKDTNAQCAFTINRQNLQLDGIPKTYGGCTTNNYGLNKSSSVMSKGLYFNNSLLIFNLGNDSNITTVEALKSLLETRPLQINYELAKPEVTELDIDLTPYYEIWDFGTEEAIASEASAPFRADIVYQFNAVDRIRNNSAKIEELETKTTKNTANIATKQKTLSLTVKDNGNIVIGNFVNNQSKEFMPATSSGDPMHKMYEAVGAVYNSTDNDIALTGIYGDTIIHKAGCWLLNEVGDLSNDDMAVIVSYPQYWSLTDMKIIAGYSPVRTTIPKRNWAELTGWYGGALNVQAQCAFFRATNLKTIAFFTGKDQDYKLRPSNLLNAFSGCKNLHKILNVINLANCTTLTNCFQNCTALEEVRIVNLKASISFVDSPDLSYESVLYMVENSDLSATSQIIITLHPTAYDRIVEYDESEDNPTAGELMHYLGLHNHIDIARG